MRRGSEQCVLVVETDLIVRQPLAGYLRECGYRVFEAADTDEAVQVLRDGGVQIDVVLCEVTSPGQFDGFGLSRWIRENGLASKVILSGSAEHVAQKAGDLCEEGPLLSKPYDHAILLDRIKSLLAQRDRNAK